MRRLLPLILLVAALAPASASAEPVGSPYRFSEDQPIVGPDDRFGSEVALSLASAANGYVLASWRGQGAGSSSVRVLGRAGASGSPREATTGTATVLANRRLPGYLGLWEIPDYENNRGSGLFAQPLSTDGTVAGPQITVAPQPYEEAVYDAEGVHNPRRRQYLVVARRAIFEFGPFIQSWLLDEQGRVVRGVRCCAAFGTGRPDVGVHRDGSYIVVWPQEAESSPDVDPASLIPRGVWSQRISSTGERIGDAMQVSSTIGDPRIAFNSHTGEALVVWTDGSEVIARRIGANGRPRGDEMTISRMGPPSDPEWQTRTPDIAYNAEARQFLVVWQSGPRREPYPIGEHVYGQHLDGSGRQIGANDFRISEGDRAQGPRVSDVRSSRDWIVAWGDPTAVARQVTATRQGATPPDGSGGRRPAAPAGLRATVDGQVVTLNWNATTDPDFAYFAVRRDTQPVVTTASWTRLPVNFTSPTATDTPGPGRYWYYVTQVNKNGQASPKSATVQVEVAQPAPPPAGPPPPETPPATGSGAPATGSGAPAPVGAGGPTPGPPAGPVTPPIPTAPVVIVQGQTPVVAAPASAPGQRAISAAQALRQARTALRLVYETAFTKGKRFKATCRRSAATRRTCTVSWRYKRFSYKGRVVVRLSRNAYSTTVSVKRTRLR